MLRQYYFKFSSFDMVEHLNHTHKPTDYNLDTDLHVVKSLIELSVCNKKNSPSRSSHIDHPHLILLIIVSYSMIVT